MGGLSCNGGDGTSSSLLYFRKGLLPRIEVFEGTSHAPHFSTEGLWKVGFILSVHIFGNMEAKGGKGMDCLQEIGIREGFNDGLSCLFSQSLYSKEGLQPSCCCGYYQLFKGIEASFRKDLGCLLSYIRDTEGRKDCPVASVLRLLYATLQGFNCLFAYTWNLHLQSLGVVSSVDVFDSRQYSIVPEKLHCLGT